MSLKDRLDSAGISIPKPIWKPEPELLLLPNIPKPLHQVAPRLVLGEKWWNKERQAAYKATDYHCLACGVPKHLARGRQWLEAHEVYRIDYAKGRMYYVKAVALCHFCHNFIHSGRLKALLDQGEIHHAKYTAIIQHGDRILAQAKLTRPLPYDGPFAEWSTWRLVIGKKQFKPKFPTYQAWLAHWASK